MSLNCIVLQLHHIQLLYIELYHIELHHFQLHRIELKNIPLHETSIKNPQELLVHYSTTTEKYYEDKGILTSYDQFHFGEGLLGVKNFPQRMAEVLKHNNKRQSELP